MSVDNRQSLIVIFRCHFTGRIGAKYPNLIIEGRRIIDELRLIKLFIQLLHNLVPNFYPDAHVHRSNLRINAMALTQMGKPLGAFPAHTGNNLLRIVGFSLICDDALRPAIFNNNILNHRHKLNFHAGGDQMILKAGINLIPFLCSEMTDWTFNQFQICPNSLCPDTLNGLVIFQTINPLICAKFQIYFIRFVQQFNRPVISEDLRQISSHIRRKGQLAIGKCSGSGKTGRNRAWLTANTLFRRPFRTVSVFNGPAFFNH